MAAREYRRVSGAGGQLYLPTRLYLGRDHLLKVTSVGTVEEYKRFYYADVQAVIVQRTTGYEWGLAATVVLALVFWLAVAGSAGGSAPRAGLYIFAVCALFFTLFALIHLMLGPTCKVWLRTAVHDEPLSSLNRLRRARKFISRLTPEIDRAQAGLQQEEIGSTGQKAHAPAYSSASVRTPLHETAAEQEAAGER